MTSQDVPEIARFATTTILSRRLFFEDGQTFEFVLDEPIRIETGSLGLGFRTEPTPEDGVRGWMMLDYRDGRRIFYDGTWYLIGK